MKLKLDENLPGELVQLFGSRGHDVDTVHSEGLVGRDDAAVFRAAGDDDRVLWTQDLDFSDIRKFKPGTHPGIVLLRLRHPSRQRLILRIEHVLESEQLDTWAGCFVVISDRKLRIQHA